MKKRKVIFFLLSAFVVYFAFIKDEFLIVEELPDAMQEPFEVAVNPKTKIGVPQSLGISIDKDKTLYIANRAGNKITEFKIDQNKIYIFKDVFNYHSGSTDKFQLIKVPFSKYKEIIRNDTLKVYIDYGPGHEIREYNLANGEYELLEYIYPTK